MKNILKYVIFIILIWGIIYELSFIFYFDRKFPDEIELEAVVKVVSIKTEKEKSNSYNVKIINSNVDSAKGTKIIIYTSKDYELNYGDIIKINGDFTKADGASNYKGFDYRKYLKQKKIYGSMYVSKFEFLEHKKSVIEVIYKIKGKCVDTLNKIYKDDVNAFLNGILLGDSSKIDEEIKENFRDSSMSHILAISGMHVSYVIVGMQFILDRLINSKKLKNNILMLLLVFFAVITGASPSCIRACIMNGMLLISQNVYRKNNFYISFLFTFIVLIFINPYNLFAVGMWLSFFGTLSIVLFHKFLKRFIECKFKIKSKFLKNFLEVFLVSFSAQIMIFPIMIYSFNTISLTFFMSNLLIYFLIGPILAIGYISMILGIFLLPIGKFIGIFENFLVVIILKIAELCSKLPLSKIYFPTPDLWMVILYYFCVAGIVILFHKKKFKFLKFILSDRMKKCIISNQKRIVSSLIIIIMIFNLYSIIPHNLRIYFVDVGQRRLYSYKNNVWKKYYYRWWK